MTSVYRPNAVHRQHALAAQATWESPLGQQPVETLELILCRNAGPRLPNTWQPRPASTRAMAAPMPDDTPVTTTTRSGLMMTPRLGPGLSSYCERSQPASNQSSCCCAVAAAPGPPAATTT